MDDGRSAAATARGDNAIVCGLDRAVPRRAADPTNAATDIVVILHLQRDGFVAGVLEYVDPSAVRPLGIDVDSARHFHAVPLLWSEDDFLIVLAHLGRSRPIGNRVSTQPKRHAPIIGIVVSIVDRSVVVNVPFEPFRVGANPGPVRVSRLRPGMNATIR